MIRSQWETNSCTKQFQLTKKRKKGTYLSRKTKKAYFSNLNQKCCRSENVLKNISTVFRIDTQFLKNLSLEKINWWLMKCKWRIYVFSSVRNHQFRICTIFSEQNSLSPTLIRMCVYQVVRKAWFSGHCAYWIDDLEPKFTTWSPRDFNLWKSRD